MPITLRYRAPDLIVGVGSARGVPVEEVDELVGAIVRESGRDPASLLAIATIGLKADAVDLIGAPR